MIPLRIHNILDYVIGAILIVAAFMFNDVQVAKNIFLVLGWGLIAYSLLTNYPYSIFKWIPLPVHMFMDVTAGIVLMASPWAFKYRHLLSHEQFIAHFVLGLTAVALVAFTNLRGGESNIRKSAIFTETRKTFE